MPESTAKAAKKAVQDAECRRIIEETGGNPDNPTALDLTRARLHLKNKQEVEELLDGEEGEQADDATTEEYRPLSAHEQTIRHLRSFLESPAVKNDRALARLVEATATVIEKASEPLKYGTRVRVLEGMVAVGLRDDRGRFDKLLKQIITGDELGRRTAALESIRLLDVMRGMLLEIFAHAYMLDPEYIVADTGQTDLVEEAERAAVAAGEQGDLVKEAADEDATHSPQEIAEAIVDRFAAEADMEVENARRAAEELKVLQPLVMNDDKPLARQTFEKRKDEAFDFYEVEKWEHVPEHRRREIGREMIDRFGLAADFEAWGALITSRDAAAAGEVKG